MWLVGLPMLVVALDQLMVEWQIDVVGHAARLEHPLPHDLLTQYFVARIY